MKQSKPCQEPGCGLSRLASVHTHGHQYLAPPKASAPRTALNHRSAEMAKVYRDERGPFVAAVLAERPQCEARFPGCWGQATTVNELIRRSHLGAIVPGGEGRENTYHALCVRCHDYITTHPTWARANGWELK